MGLKNTAVQKSCFYVLIAFASLALLASGCAPLRTHPETAEVDADDKANSGQTQANEQLSKLQEKIQDLETRLTALNDKINIENSGKDIQKPGSAVSTEVVHTPAAHAHGIPKTASARPDTFVQNEAVDRYREAKILFDSKRYSDAILEFSSFAKNHPDHALASSAQYFVGMGYFQQAEFKLSEEELSRGLLNYPHSNVTPDTLAALANVSEKLNKPARVAYYRQKLLSSFPNSPQAKGIDLNAKPKETAAVTATAAKPEPTVAEAVHTVINKKPAVTPPSEPEAPVPPKAPEGSKEDEHLKETEHE